MAQVVLSAARPIAKLPSVSHTHGSGAGGGQYAPEWRAFCSRNTAIYGMGGVTLAVIGDRMHTSQQRAPGAPWRAERDGAHVSICASTNAARGSGGCCTGILKCTCRLRAELYMNVL